MLPTFSGAPSQNTSTFVALCETLNARCRPMFRTSKAKVSENGIGEAPGFRLSDSIGGAEARCIQKPARTLCTTRVGGKLSVSREVKRILLREVVLAINRRNFLQSGSIVSVSLAFAKAGRLFSAVTTLDRWRTFQVTTRVEVLKTSGTTRVWVPAALIRETPFQKNLTNTFNCEGGTAKMVESKSDALGIITAEFPAGVRPILTVTNRVATKD